MTGRIGRRGDPCLAVDIGTSSVRIATKTAVVVDEPSVIARDASANIVSAGRDALEIVGRAPRELTTTSPIHEGVVADVAAAEQLLRVLFRRGVRSRRWRRPSVVAAGSLVSTGLERRALQHALQRAGAGENVLFVESPMAAAVGAGLPVEEAFGTMVVDVGRGATEIGIMALGALVTACAERVGGGAADAAIARHLREQRGIAVGERTAERVKQTLSECMACTTEVRGVDVASGLPRTIQVETADLVGALDDVLSQIATAARSALDQAPPTLAADVMEEGIVLTGGSSVLPGLATRIANATGIEVRIAPRPAHSVIEGLRACLHTANAVAAT